MDVISNYEGRREEIRVPGENPRLSAVPIAVTHRERRRASDVSGDKRVLSTVDINALYGRVTSTITRPIAVSTDAASPYNPHPTFLHCSPPSLPSFPQQPRNQVDLFLDNRDNGTTTRKLGTITKEGSPPSQVGDPDWPRGTFLIGRWTLRR